MLWVGGHILLVGVDELGWHTVYDWVHHAEEAVGGGALGWVVNTLASALMVVGALVVAVVTVVKRLRSGRDREDTPAPTEARRRRAAGVTHPSAPPRLPCRRSRMP